jgi:hypothetical protein
MKRLMTAALCVASTAAGAVELESLAPKLLSAHAPAQVLIDYVLSVDQGGSPQRVQGQAEGVMISADGVVLLPEAVLNPADVFRRVSGDGQGAMGFNSMRSAEFTIRIAGRAEPLPASVLAQDRDVGIAWLKLDTPPKALNFINLSRGREPRVGEPAFGIGMVGELYAFAPFVEDYRILGAVDVPFRGYITASNARLLFGADQRPIGYAVMRFSGVPNLAALGAFKSFSIVVPATKLRELTERALTARRASAPRPGKSPSAPK